jgi:hypothetical protein
VFSCEDAAASLSLNAAMTCGSVIIHILIVTKGYRSHGCGLRQDRVGGGCYTRPRDIKEFDYARAGEIEEHKRRRAEEAATSAANTSGVNARPACPCDQATLGASLAGEEW